MPRKKLKKKKATGKFQIIGVRFASSPRQIYSYQVKAAKKVYLGQELVVQSPFGRAIVFVVMLNYVGNYNGPLKEITEKVARL